MNTVDINGRKIWYEKRGAGVPLLLIHGYPLDHAAWDALAVELQADFELIIPDLPGFGRSDVLAEGFGLRDVAEALVGLLDSLGIGKVYLAGHSMGGYIALSLAHHFSGRVLGLALVGSQAAADSAERKAGRYATAKLVELNGVAEVLGMAEKLTNQPGLTQGLSAIILRQREDGIRGALGAMAERPDAMPFFEDFRFPVILVHGLADGLIPVERAREIDEKYRCRMFLLPGVGHSPMLEAPHETAEAIRSFLA